MAVCLPYYSPFKSASQALTPHHRQTGLRLFIHSQRKIQTVTSPGVRLRITAHQQQLLLTAFGRRRCNAGKGKKREKKKTRISYCSDPWRDHLWSEWRREMREESLCHCLFSSSSSSSFLLRYTVPHHRGVGHREAVLRQWEVKKAFVMLRSYWDIQRTVGLIKAQGQSQPVRL